MRGIIREQKVHQIKLKQAKAFRSEMTKEEEIIWRCLRRNKLNGLHFRRQQVLFGFIVDFYCHAAGIIVEIDGEIHQNQIETDHLRDQLINEHGLEVLRITNEEVHNNLHTVLERIAQTCKNAPPFPDREGG